MIVEERIYTLKPDRIGDYLKLYEEEGLPIQTRILPRMLGYFVSDIGVQHQVVHLWGYENYAQREAKRFELTSNPAWKAYVKKIRPMFLHQENRIMVPTAWSPIR